MSAVSGDRLQIDVLGPLRARDSLGRDVTPDGVLQRRLLALLVLRRGQVVSPDVAIDVVWPGRRPRDPLAALHNHLFRLRRALPDDVIESAGDGYRLDPSRVDLDADRLAAAVNMAQPVDRTVVLTIDEVLDRWHGPAYPELDDFDDGRMEAVRLDELRVRAVEVRAECRLAAGDVDGVVVELAALADAEPLRERPRALLMTALARSGPRSRRYACTTTSAGYSATSWGSSRRRRWPPSTPVCWVALAKRVGCRQAGCRFR